MPPDPDDDAAAPVDPFADLLFTLIAAVLPAILVLLPAMHLSRAVPPAPDAPAPELRVRGTRTWPIVAGAEGLRLTGAGDRIVPPDAVPDDAGLRAELARLRREGGPLVLIVEPAGLESAFLLDPVAAQHGPPEMVQVRAAEPCAATRDAALAQACRAGESRPGALAPLPAE